MRFEVGEDTKIGTLLEGDGTCDLSLTRSARSVSREREECRQMSNRFWRHGNRHTRFELLIRRSGVT